MLIVSTFPKRRKIYFFKNENTMKKNHEFLDIRKSGFTRVAVVIPRVHIANPVKNEEEHFKLLEKVYAEGVQYALCPELGLSSYTAGDLFHNDQLIQTSKEALLELVRKTHQMNMLISVGVPLRIDGKLFNCGVTFRNGRIFGVTVKAYLPNYREFYEHRHFSSGRELTRKIVTFGIHKDVAIGMDVLIRSNQNEHFALHLEICEDMWVPIPWSAKAALHGATILANLSASNITIGKSDFRELLILAQSAKCNAVQMYSAAGLGESTTDLAWDGDGYIAERGSVLSRTERFAMKGTYTISDVDLLTMCNERMRQGSFSENALDNPTNFREIYFDDEYLSEQSERHVIYQSFKRKIDSHPFVPHDEARRDERCYETFKIQALSLARRLEALGEERRKIIIGVSGGQDSTHALNIAAHTMDLLGLPRTNIIAITMPGFGTTDRTYKNACRLIKAVGATLLEIPIRDLAKQSFRDIGIPDVDLLLQEIRNIVEEGRRDLESQKKKLTFENIQAWLRKHTLFSISVSEGGIVLGTGDLSELLVGWCTYGGDQFSHYGVNAGVPKTLISYLILWAVDVIFKDEPEVQEVLRDIVKTPISPELLPPGEDGTITQKTENEVGPYELIDFFGYHFVRFGKRPSHIARLCYHAFDGKYTVGEIKHWLSLFLSRFFANQFKRSTLPDGPKVGLTCISPRGDWRMPSDAKPDIWLADVSRNIPDVLEFPKDEEKTEKITK